MGKILFSAEWCNPCQQLKKFASENNITFDTDEGSKQGMKYNIRSVPTIIETKGGVEVNRTLGFDRKAILTLRGGNV